ncbi:MAG: hypothetical protein GC204_07560 [Chloroflexi bacterium]|nr:hypothetical protein [Chloroflexota bacterium]
MPIEVSWLYPQRIASVRFYGVVALDDVKAQVLATDSMIDEATPPLHFFIDSTEVEKYDLTLAQIRAVFPPHNPKTGWTVVYGTSRVTRFFASIMMQLIKGSFHFVDSYEEAITFIAHADSSLQDLKTQLSVE